MDLGGSPRLYSDMNVGFDRVAGYGFGWITPPGTRTLRGFHETRPGPPRIVVTTPIHIENAAIRDSETGGLPGDCG